MKIKIYSKQEPKNLKDLTALTDKEYTQLAIDAEYMALVTRFRV
jgi:hypothetical protein